MADQDGGAVVESTDRTSVRMVCRMCCGRLGPASENVSGIKLGLCQWVSLSVVQQLQICCDRIRCRRKLVQLLPLRFARYGFESRRLIFQTEGMPLSAYLLSLRRFRVFANWGRTTSVFETSLVLRVLISISRLGDPTIRHSPI